ncbi:hypothetical protein LTR49_026859 [Elasticomyces elasticus]|nr:hypothetical protein LTR49_026859 [Elasticomyces elasticus]
MLNNLCTELGRLQTDAGKFSNYLKEPPRMDALLAQSAGHRLTCVFELLEQVLLETDMKDILLAQRVNTTFASTIANSKALQQALFFMPLDHPDNPPTPTTLLFEQIVLQRLPLFLNGSDEKRIAELRRQRRPSHHEGLQIRHVKEPAE